ncbi:hypothetical protein Pelo_992 [Pelomyxa schiedti]|nr:hypothetical protein Pelo_992 [Pelomyxa schiedti]
MLSILPTANTSLTGILAETSGTGDFCPQIPLSSSPSSALTQTASSVYWAGPRRSQNLPVDVLVEVFKNLDVVSLGRASQVCWVWDVAARTDSLWAAKCESAVASCRMVTSSVESRIAPLKTHYTQTATKERLDFLLATVRLMKDYFTSQMQKHSWTGFPDCKFSCHLIHCVYQQLCQTSDMVQLLESGKFKITINFDIFELTLRRYYEELKVMIPLPVTDRVTSTSYGIDSSSPAQDDPRLAVLNDKISRDLWRENIGRECYAHFDTFYNKLIVATFPTVSDNPRFRDHLRHYLNFPTDNLLTVYRFHVLVALFGPVRDIAKNFETYVLGQGFLGLINMIKAEEILRKERPTVDTVLVRFSRQKPTQLAFTSFNVKDRTIEHRRNVDKAGRPIPIATFLKEQYPRHNLIQLGVDDEVTRTHNTFVYAAEDSPYCSYGGRV